MSIILPNILDFQGASPNEGKDFPFICSDPIRTNNLKIPDKNSWQHQLKKLKQIELEFRQNQIINDVDSRINKFDNDLNELKQIRLKTETDIKFLEIRLVSLNQELCIVKDFERIENHLIDQVEDGERQYSEVMTTIEELNQEIVSHSKKIKNNNELIVNINQQFSGSVANNKYTKFLSKVFKKKQPKEKKEGDDEEDQGKYFL